MLSKVIIALPTVAALSVKYMVNSTTLDIWILAVSILSIIISITTVLLIWKFSKSLMKDEKDPADEMTTYGINVVMKIILACMGVYFIIDAAMVFPMALVNFRLGFDLYDENPDALMFLITQVIEFSLGCLLIAKPGKWVKAIRLIGEI